jgi:hypothetical protein
MAVGQIRLDRADAGEIDTGPALPIQSDGGLIAHAVKDSVGRVVVHVMNDGAERVVARFEEDEQAQIGLGHALGGEAVERALFVDLTKNGQQAHERRRKNPTTRAISESPSMRSADQERKALPVTSDKKGALSVARRRKR